jgi:hypothetical protein
MPIRPSNKRKAKVISNHAQHGQSAFNPNARTKSNEARDAASVVVYTTGGG